jgi:CubicO group peptidase (beta-lactamase class C family)
MKRITCVSTLVLLLLAACAKGEDNDYVYTPPLAGDDGLETATLESVGMESGPLQEMMDRINDTEQHRIHDILVMKNGRLVFEEYFQGYALDMDAPNRDGRWMQYDRETDHFMASVSKSVTSVVVGVAVRQGLLPDLDRKVSDFYPEYADILVAEKAGITLNHLLTMTSGLSFDENSYPYGDERNDVTRMFTEADPIRFVLAQPLTSAPGARFFYNSGTVNVLAAIVARAAKMKFLDFANANLFDLLHTQGGIWQSFSSGDTFASGGLFLRARELAKIGRLFLDGGAWQGQPLISADWIARSQQEHVATSGFPFAQAYGYLWWIRNFMAGGTAHKCFFAAGWGDQYMFILPDLDMIIVFNCGNYAVNARISPLDLVEDYILAAVR